MKDITIHEESLAQRLYEIRVELYGPGRAGLETMAVALSLPAKAWRKYESGMTMPATVMVRLLVVTGATSRWLMTGQGERFFQRPTQPRDRLATASRAGALARDDS